jgi:NADH-ubiquinone oxidoreductase chain 2
VLGLTQYRIKRLFAYSTISHVGFILLGLCADSMESIQACIFYILQYTISNLNAFLILLSVGFSLYLYVYERNGNTQDINRNLVDKDNSPIQLITQMKGYFYTNSFLSISLAITLFSFIGIPPIAGFFAKQMILSAALDKSFVFLAIIAIITSVIGAAYYLNIVKQIFFYNNDYKVDSLIADAGIIGYITNNNNNNTFKGEKKQQNNTINLDYKDITINSGLSSSISIISLILLSFIFIPEE